MRLDPSRPYIFTVDEVLSADECRELMARIDREGPTVAPITTLQGPRMATHIRNNERVMLDDEPLAQDLYERLLPEVPEEIHGMQVAGLNERFRCYRYRPGMRFKMHPDGAFYRNEREQSYYTVLVYLNDGFEGGHTVFAVQPEVSIRPKAGMALLFQHPIVHEGAEVLSGVKYVLRSDLMYRKPPHLP